LREHVSWDTLLKQAQDGLRIAFVRQANQFVDRGIQRRPLEHAVLLHAQHVRMLGLAVVQAFIPERLAQLLSGPDAGELDLDVLPGFQPRKADEVFGQIDERAHRRAPS